MSKEAVGWLLTAVCVQWVDCSHLYLGISNGLFPSVFHIKSLPAYFSFPFCVPHNHLYHPPWLPKLYLVKVKVKRSRYRPGVAQRVGRGIALLLHDRGTRSGWVVSSTPGRTLHPGKTWYPFYRRLGGPQGQSGRAENLVPTGIRSRTVQPVVSHYTNWATCFKHNFIFIKTELFVAATFICAFILYK